MDSETLTTIGIYTGTVIGLTWGLYNDNPEDSSPVRSIVNVTTMTLAGGLLGGFLATQLVKPTDHLITTVMLASSCLFMKGVYQEFYLRA
jgi:hypothetical protein